MYGGWNLTCTPCGRGTYAENGRRPSAIRATRARSRPASPRGVRPVRARPRGPTTARPTARPAGSADSRPTTAPCCAARAATGRRRLRGRGHVHAVRGGQVEPLARLRQAELCRRPGHARRRRDRVQPVRPRLRAAAHRAAAVRVLQLRHALAEIRREGVQPDEPGLLLGQRHAREAVRSRHVR